MSDTYYSKYFGTGEELDEALKKALEVDVNAGIAKESADAAVAAADAAVPAAESAASSETNAKNSETAAQAAQSAAEKAKEDAEQARNEAQAIAGGDYLTLAGGTVTGPITLPGDPTRDLQAATKQYVDNNFLPSSTPVTIEKGGTGKTTRKDAYGALTYLGYNPHGGLANDIPSVWGTLGNGFARINDGNIVDQPYGYGVIYSMNMGYDLIQFWFSVPFGDIYKRNGYNDTTTWTRTWYKVYDENNKPTPAEIGAPTVAEMNAAIQAAIEAALGS